MEEMNREGVIYMYTSPSGKKYIGQTKNELKRKSDHKSRTLNVDTAFGRALKKYGYENFKYEILFKCKSKSNKRLSIILDTMETYLIKKFDSINKGYNLASGGSVPIMHEETKLKISNTLKGKTFSDERKQNISKALKGRVLSEETKKKISEANKGKVFTDEHKSHMGISVRKIVYQYDKHNNLIKEWVSIADASRVLNIKDSNISLACKGIRKSAGKFIWKYKNE